MKSNLTATYYMKAFMHWCNQPVDRRVLGKNAVALFFLLAFLLQTFNKPFIIASYYVDSSSYEALCENKAKPELQCHGKCQVMKQLASEEKKDQQNPGRSSENRTELICNAAIIEAIQPACFNINLPGKINPVNSGELADFSFDFFHPPQA